MPQRTITSRHGTRPGQLATADGRFPPLSISHKHFIKNGSDRQFRQLVYALIGLSALMVQNRQRFAAYVGLTDPQYTMITLIAENPGLTVGELAELLRVSSQFVTIEIGNLVKKQVVEKTPNAKDRRIMMLNLTKKGRDLLIEVGPLRRRINDLMFRSLTEERANTLKDIIDALMTDGTNARHELDAPPVRDRAAKAAI
jgi:DNA-binding MarR family transcriptional regulator